MTRRAASTWTSSPASSRRQRGLSSIGSVANTTDDRSRKCVECARIRLLRKWNSGAPSPRRSKIYSSWDSGYRSAHTSVAVLSNTLTA
ncbi:Uncharacterised protein [Mycobacterium tuberculosis]|nr:Uncharacterised protein [Mycobacterium tuberculosis]